MVADCFFFFFFSSRCVVSCRAVPCVYHLAVDKNRIILYNIFAFFCRNAHRNGCDLARENSMSDGLEIIICNFHLLLPFFFFSYFLFVASRSVGREKRREASHRPARCVSTTTATMFLNPWYGQVGGGPEGARVHTAEEGAAATAAAAVATAAAASGVGGDDDDDRVPATCTSSSITAATGHQQQQQQTTAVNSIKATASSVDSTEATAAMSDASASAAAATPVINRFEMIQQSLKSGWTAHFTQDGRLFYCK